jgi:hypothetical protein
MKLLLVLFSIGISFICTSSVFSIWETYPNYDQFEDVYLSRIQNDAYYHIEAYSENGNIAQLYDDSIWEINSSDQHKVLQWRKRDEIFIKPCCRCFSFYPYVLYNRQRNEVVEATLEKVSSIPLEKTFYIIAIDSDSRLVQLNNYTIWQIDSKAYNFRYWKIGQRILIGVNNHWRTAVFPHILINADVSGKPHSKAIFAGYAG